jgi:hypothetical protein
MASILFLTCTLFYTSVLLYIYTLFLRIHHFSTHLPVIAPRLGGVLSSKKKHQ